MPRLCLLFLLGCATRYELGKCDSSGSCPAGASCRFDECVAEHSLAYGDACSDTLQCSSDLSCFPGIPICSQACTHIYSAASECATKDTCVPIADKEHPGFVLGGACVSQECRMDSDCAELSGLLSTPSPHNKCLRGVCILSCKLGKRMADDPHGMDACVSDRRGNPTHCSELEDGGTACTPVGTAAIGAACTIYPLAGDPPACDLTGYCSAGKCAPLP